MTLSQRLHNFVSIETFDELAFAELIAAAESYNRERSLEERVLAEYAYLWQLEYDEDACSSL